jgi:hypothetical protein
MMHVTPNPAYVQDVGRLAAFYQRAFGLPIVEEIKGEWAVLDTGACQHVLHRVGKAWRVDDPSYSLWAAVWRDDVAMCRALLEAKPRLNLRAHGETPIFYAVRLKRLKALDLLIAARADPSIADDQGRDAVEVARQRRLPQDVVVRLAQLRARA